MIPLTPFLPIYFVGVSFTHWYDYKREGNTLLIEGYAFVKLEGGKMVFFNFNEPRVLCVKRVGDNLATSLEGEPGVWRVPVYPPKDPLQREDIQKPQKLAFEVGTIPHDFIVAACLLTGNCKFFNIRRDDDQWEKRLFASMLLFLNGGEVITLETFVKGDHPEHQYGEFTTKIGRDVVTPLKWGWRIRGKGLRKIGWREALAVIKDISEGQFSSELVL